jgi:hypothetical protein
MALMLLPVLKAGLVRVPPRDEVPVPDDADTVMDAARAAEGWDVDAEGAVAGWASGARLLRGCVVDASPLRVALEYSHRDDAMSDPSAVRVLYLSRPWRTGGWRVVEDGIGQEAADSDACGVTAVVLREGRARHVRAVARASWRAYSLHARGADTLRPRARDGVDDYGGMAVTAADSLDTLWLLGLRDEFEEACAIVNATPVATDAMVSVFETSIRVLGGLLSAHALSGRGWLLDRAAELGKRLLPAFLDGARLDGAPLPRSDVRPSTGQTSNPPWGSRSLSELSLTLEMRHLSSSTGDPSFSSAADAAEAALGRGEAMREGALLPAFVRIGEGGKLRFSGPVTLGARADSYYEYLLKEWVRSGGGASPSAGGGRRSFAAAAWRARERLLSNVTSGRVAGLPRRAFVGERDEAGKWVGKMDHLACFWPGALALAVREGALPSHPHLSDAEAVLRTCLDMHSTPSRLAPEITRLDGEGKLVVWPRDAHNLLRPETLESLYVVWSVTGDDSLRDRAWEVFDAMERAARVVSTPGEEGGGGDQVAPGGDGVVDGYACVEDVTRPVDASRRMGKSAKGARDSMPSYWMAESIKYAWLATSGTDLTRSHVFNTEAHPFPRVQKQSPPPLGNVY